MMHMLQNKDSDPYRLVQEHYIKIIFIIPFFLILENNAFDRCIGHCFSFSPSGMECILCKVNPLTPRSD